MRQIGIRISQRENTYSANEQEHSKIAKSMSLTKRGNGERVSVVLECDEVEWCRVDGMGHVYGLRGYQEEKSVS